MSRNNLALSEVFTLYVRSQILKDIQTQKSREEKLVITKSSNQVIESRERIIENLQ